MSRYDRYDAVIGYVCGCVDDYCSVFVVVGYYVVFGVSLADGDSYADL